jgi:competence protein ComEA
MFGACVDSLPVRPQPARPFGELLRAWLLWFGLTRLIVSAFAVLAVGAGGFWLLRAPPTAVESTLPYAKGSSGQSAAASTTIASLGSGSVPSAAPVATSVPAIIVVHVAGAVVAPGVYELPATSRLHQAITAAGGLAGDADRDALNLASLLRDGDRVFVPLVGQATPAVVAPTGGSNAGSSATAGPAGPVDLNRATAADLDGLPGVGPATAAAIIAYRDQQGPFATVDDLLKVRGIGPAKLDAMRSLVRT